MLVKLLNWLIKRLKLTGKISDGYHTFDELYEHRVRLYLALCKHGPKFVWKSRKHSDGTSYPGWFLLGMNTVPGLQMTYHIPDKYWDHCQ